MKENEQIARLEAEIAAVRRGCGLTVTNECGEPKRVDHATASLISGMVQSQAILTSALILLLQDAGLITVDAYTNTLAHTLGGELAPTTTVILSDLVESLNMARTATPGHRFEVIYGGLQPLNDDERT